MIKNITLTFFLALSLVACNSKDAFNYSENFVAKHEKLEVSIEKTENDIEKFVEAEKFDSVAIVAEKMEAEVQAVIAEITATPAPDAEEGEKFKVDIKKYFEYIKSVYTNYKAYGKATNQDARDVEMQRMQALVEKSDEATKTIQNSQASYAKANGFKLESIK